MAKTKSVKKGAPRESGSHCPAVKVLGTHVYSKAQSGVDSYHDRYVCQTCGYSVTWQTRHSLRGNKRAPYRSLDFRDDGESTWRFLEERIERASRGNLLKLAQSLDLPLAEFDHQQPAWLLRLWLCDSKTKLFRENFFVNDLVNDKSTPAEDIFRLYELATTVEDIQEHVLLIRKIASGTATPSIILAGLRQEGTYDIVLASNPSIPKSGSRNSLYHLRPE